MFIFNSCLGGQKSYGLDCRRFLIGFLTRERDFIFPRASRKLNVKKALKVVLVPHIAFLNPLSLAIVTPGVKIFVHIKEIIQ